MFHALVAVKQVPDTTNIRIDPETGNLIRQGVPTILNPYDAQAAAIAAVRLIDAPSSGTEDTPIRFDVSRSFAVSTPL